MAREKLPGIITANDLLSGEVVYLTSEKTWARDISAAHVFAPELENDAVQSVADDVNKIVGAYWSEVEVKDKKIIPVHFREKFRARGFVKPTGGIHVSI